MKTNWKVIFRVDASLEIGTGHVMRCLTLANYLKAYWGATCEFICREHQGNLISLIRESAFTTHQLPIGKETDSVLMYGQWLGSTQEEDFELCEPILANFQPHWLVVDHYGLNVQWEKLVAKNVRRIMVIDDLVNREHFCHLLLDQTYARRPEEYQALLHHDCEILCGSDYVLLRSEFAELRSFSLLRRSDFPFRNLLVFLGGVDRENLTSKVLDALDHCDLPKDCKVNVVLGSTAPWVSEVRHVIESVSLNAELFVAPGKVAQLMANSDLAIGAAGATSWERCCLGLPTILLVLAQNQSDSAAALEAVGAVSIIRPTESLTDRLPKIIRRLMKDKTSLIEMSRIGADIVDGLGAARVSERLLGLVNV